MILNHFPNFREFPELPTGVIARARMRPRHRLSGDIVLADASNKDILFVIGGIVSHGAAAAFSGSIVRNLIVAARRELERTPKGRLLPALASILHRELVTAELARPLLPIVFVLVDTEQWMIEVLNCGSHAIPIRIRNGEATHLTESSLPLGFIAPGDLPFWRDQILEGDSFLFLTDGIIEQSESYDIHSMLRHIAELAREGPEDFIGAVFGRLDKLGVAEPQDDDQTLLALSFRGAMARGLSQDRTY